MQNKELNNKYRNNKLIIDSNKYIKSIQFIILVLNYKRLKRNR